MSPAGRAVHGFLLAGAARAHGTFHGPVGAMELLFQVYSVAARRALAREAGSRAVTSHVAQAFARLGLEPDERIVQKGVHATEAALGRIRWKHGAFARDFGVVSRLLTDLVRAGGMDGARIGELVAEGEHRMWRLRRSRRRDREGRRRWPWHRLRDALSDRVFAVTVAENPAAASDCGGARPRSITGYALRALARHDPETVHALPDDPSAESVQAVIDNAFAVAVRERFGDRACLTHVGLLAAEVARLSRGEGLTAAAVESVLLAEFTGVAPQRGPVLEIKAAVFVRIADDLGLFEREIDDMILMAERMAEEDGVELSLLDAGDIDRS